MDSKFENDLLVNWYRTPVDPGMLQELNLRSDAKGLVQAGGHLGLMVLTGTLAVYVQQQLTWLLLVPALFLHGTICAFMSNAGHELVHGTVFRRPWLNSIFLKLFGFLRWFPYDYYWASHTEHHKYTLYPPQDREVVLPTRFTLSGFLSSGFVDPARFIEMLKTNLRHGRGRLEGEWEAYLLESDPVRYSVFRWARILLAGHAAIAAVSIYYGYWIIPVVVSLTPCYGGWLFLLCNDTQHAGLQDKVADFRLNCRTMYLNPVVEFLYWHMNFHTEHHMYAAVPCYNLRRLSDAIKHDLPPLPNGLVETWRQIIAIQQRQRVEPEFSYNPNVPGVNKPKKQESMAAAQPLQQPDGTPAGKGNRLPRIWECSVCGFVYTERVGLPNEGIAPGTAWEDIPDTWKCPDCGTGKADFQMVEVLSGITSPA
jgi:fatty acid desaturase/rubredoxin